AQLLVRRRAEDLAQRLPVAGVRPAHLASLQPSEVLAVDRRDDAVPLPHVLTDEVCQLGSGHGAAGQSTRRRRLSSRFQLGVPLGLGHEPTRYYSNQAWAQADTEF